MSHNQSHPSVGQIWALGKLDGRYGTVASVTPCPFGGPPSRVKVDMGSRSYTHQRKLSFYWQDWCAQVPTLVREADGSEPEPDPKPHTPLIHITDPVRNALERAREHCIDGKHVVAAIDAVLIAAREMRQKAAAWDYFVMHGTSSTILLNVQAQIVFNEAWKIATRQEVDRG